MIARFDVLTREPVSGPEDAMRALALFNPGRQMQPALSLPLRGLDLLHLRQRLKQRLRLSDLGHI